MKKIFAFAFLLLSSFSLFAFDMKDWIVNTDLGLGVPFFQVNMEYSGIEKKSKGIGIDFDYKGQLIHKSSGFTFQAGLSLGGICVSDFYAGDSQWGFDLNAELGFGYAFIRNKDAILSLSGVFGYDFSVLKKDISYYSGGYRYDAELKSKQMIFFLGADISVTYRISNIIGLYGSFLFGVPVFGFGSINEGRENVKAGFFYIKPSIGVSITVD